MTASKRLVRKILPKDLRRRLQALRDDEQILGRNVWTLLTSGRIERAMASGVLYSQTTRPLANIDPFSLSPSTALLLEPWRSWEQSEKVMMVRGTVFIEPRFGWVIRHPCHLVLDCVIDPGSAPRPSLKAYLQARLTGRARVHREHSVISLRDRGEVNYWHFLNDILGRIRLADRCGIGPDIPLVVGRRAFQQPFVKELLESSELANRIIIQADNFVRADMVVCFQTARHSLDQIDFLLKFLQAPGGDPRRNRRVFLARAAGSGRLIANMATVEQVCRTFNLDLVVTEGMTVREQVELFSDVRYLVAIHGAGLMNLIFRRGAPMSVLEIFPPMSYRGSFAHPPHYFWISHALGFDYDCMFGKARREETRHMSYVVDARTVWRNMRRPFEVEASELSHRIEAMLQAKSALDRAT